MWSEIGLCRQAKTIQNKFSIHLKSTAYSCKQNALADVSAEWIRMTDQVKTGDTCSDDANYHSVSCCYDRIAVTRQSYSTTTASCNSREVWVQRPQQGQGTEHLISGSGEQSLPEAESIF